MANDNKYIPALRFPEFQNDGEWGLASVGIYYKVQGGFAFKSGEFKDSGIPIVRISNIPNDGNYVDTNNCVYYDRIPNEKSFLIAKGDLLIAMSGATTGKTAVYNKDNEAYLNQRVGLFKSTNSQNYYPFICQWVKTELFQNQLKRTLAAGAQPNISSKDIESFTLIYPTSDNSSNEQKKIADCLSSLDSYIDATKRKLEQLKEHKKGLMQRLFPAKGKTIPALRFPEFQNEGEWNYENGDILYGSIVNKKHKSDLPILAITQENGAIPRDEINYRVVVEDKSIEGYKVVEIGDFIISLRSFQGGIEYSRYKGLCSPAYIVLRKRHSKICDDFYRHYFKSFQYIQELNRNLEGIRDGKMVSYKQFADIKLPYPCYEEQCKIAKCLSSIDDVIQSYIEKKRALELHKNGLMQQIFPKL